MEGPDVVYRNRDFQQINTGKTVVAELFHLTSPQNADGIPMVLRLYLIEFTAWTGWNDCYRADTVNVAGKFKRLLNSSTEEVFDHDKSEL